MINKTIRARLGWQVGLPAVIVAGCSALGRWLLPAGTLAWLELLLLALLLVTAVGAALVLVIAAGGWLVTHEHAAWLTRLGGAAWILTGALVSLVGLVALSQALATTPPIRGADGRPLPNSVAALERVRLGGVDQWIIVRGHDVNKPVLLFLSGGPGSSEAARVLRFNAELEQHFVVVIWEQRGCGKSYPSHQPADQLGVDRYVSDIIELSDLLRQRFDESKIYLVGHSWGTIIGLRAAQARPDLFHAYVGTAQMVDVLETDLGIYTSMLAHARQSGDQAYEQSLLTQGPPPYLGDNPIVPYATLFGREYAVFEAPITANPDFARDGDALLLMLQQPEYGWLDRLNNLRGLQDTFNVVYPQLQGLDFRQDATRLDLPVYLVVGRLDHNAPPQLAQSYFDVLEAPHRELIYFEHSGHGMIWQEPDKFRDLLIQTVLPQTYPEAMGKAS